MNGLSGFPRSLAFYRFRSEWRAGASTGTAFEVLKDIERYPQWWPEVKRVRRIDDARAEVRIRSLVPYVLNVTLQEDIADPQAGLLRTSISGDLVGWSSWTITALAGGSGLLYEQEVEVAKRLVSLLSPIARPLFRFNHALMMRRGEQGLNRYLE
jgi:hypothetical protein